MLLICYHLAEDVKPALIRRCFTVRCSS